MRITSCAPAVALLAVVVGASCSDPVDPPVQGSAALRVVHASPLLGAIDVRVADVSAVSGLGFGHTSPLVTVPSGVQVITVRSNGSLVAELSANLMTDRDNAMTVGRDTTQISPVIPDTGHAITNRANIRLINVVGSNKTDPTLLQVRLRFPDVGDSTALLGLDSKIASHGPLMYFNPGHFSLTIVPQGGTTVLAQAEFDVAAGQKRAIVLERSANGAYSVRIVVEP
jgi:hypothetical protein